MSTSQPENSNIVNHEERRSRRRRVQLGMGVFVASIGLMSFSRVAGNARFEAYHTLDVIQLMIAGAGLGVALVLLLQFFVIPRSD